jgi:hypothetical protein
MLAETWQVWSSDLGAIGACSAIRDQSLRVPTPCTASIGFGIRPDEHLPSELARYADSVTTSSVRKGTALALTYAAQLAQPMLVADPPTLDFGSVLVATSARRTLTLHNHSQCPICYTVDYPHTPEWVIETNSTVVTESESIEIELTFAEKTVVDAMITIIMFWCDSDGIKVPELPATTLQIPVCAIVDRPILGISKRVLDLGIVFPTVTYNTTTEIALLNAFRTDVKFICESRDTVIHMPRESESVSPVPPSDPPTIIDICRSNENHEAVVREYAEVTNEVSTLEPEQWTRIDIIATFSRLGHNMIPIICRSMGNWSRLAVIADVNPPHVRLVTPTIDFSEDFVICNRSHAYCHAENECEVPSTIRVEMIDNCNGVFSLDDDGVFDLLPFSCVRIPVSCYSEIHGDYHGELNLRIRDPWQTDDIRIPLHVKARGSYFGFQKHTLGYEPGPDGDRISFGRNICVGSRSVLRRISLVNYSSEAITVDWSLSSFVKARQYADLVIDVTEEGDVKINITELSDADLQFPFRMTTTRTQIASHGTTVVRVEFEPNELGEFGACIAARSGEFVHTLDLHATVVDEASAHPKYIEESEEEDD